MELIRHEVPFDNEGYLALLEKIFGREEAELERIQVDGSENRYNRDVTFTAEENGTVCGTSHITFPKDNPKICGLSGLCTDPVIRGTGMGRKLFAALVEEADRNGIEAAYLGTNNPMASVMYASYGFEYIPGTYVMVRFKGTDRNRFYLQYGKEPQNVAVRKLDPGMRIGVIPMLTNEGPGFLLDSNTGIFNNRIVTQQSTMGLYPKFLDVVLNGGTVYQAVSEDGILGGVATARKENGRVLADFFCMESFRPAAPALIRKFAEDGQEVLFRVSEADTEKQQILQEQGWKKTGTEPVKYGELQVLCGLWAK